MKKFLYFKIKIKNKYLRFKLAFQKLIKKKFVKSVYGVYLKGNYNDVNNQISVKWNDKRINYNWPTKKPILSFRDK